MIMVQISAGRAMTAHHIIGVNFEFGLGIELGGLRKQQCMRRLLAIGLLRILSHNNLTLENAPRLVIHHAFEHFPRRAMGHLVIHHKTRISMLCTLQQIGTCHAHIAIFAKILNRCILPIDLCTGCEREVIVCGFRRKLNNHMRKMMGSRRFSFDFHMIQPRPLANADGRHGIVEVVAFAHKGFNNLRRCIIGNRDMQPAGDCKISACRDMENFNGPVIIVAESHGDRFGIEFVIQGQQWIFMLNGRGIVGKQQPINTRSDIINDAIYNHQSFGVQMLQRSGFHQTINGFGVRFTHSPIRLVDQPAQISPFPIFQAACRQRETECLFSLGLGNHGVHAAFPTMSA